VESCELVDLVVKKKRRRAAERKRKGSNRLKVKSV